MSHVVPRLFVTAMLLGAGACASTTPVIPCG